MTKHTLVAQNIQKSFGGAKVLTGATFAVNQGEITGIIGPNGAGKTTMFNILTGFIQPEEGSLVYDGQHIEKVLPHVRAKLGLGRTFQQSKLFLNMSVEENLLLACSHEYDTWYKSLFTSWKEKQLKKQVRDTLRQFGLSKLLHMQAKDLSYGQGKLVSLLRCLLMDTDTVLLDEPSAGVNRTLLKTVVEVIKYMEEEGKTVVIIEHNMPFLMELSKSVIVLDRGHVMLHDTPENVQNNEHVLDAYLGKRDALTD